MANEMFTQLPTVTNASMTDIICAVQSYVSPSNPGLSVQETLQQVYNLFQSNVILTYNGNPNGHVAGTLNTLLWDSTDKVLYVCTTAGSTTTAVWTPSTGQATNGQIPIGSTGNPPVLSTITAGTNISISNSYGSITISASGSGGFSWNHVTGTSQAMVSNNGYIADNASVVTLTLPTTSAIGDELEIVGRGAGGWTITYGTSQYIYFGNITTTTTTGSLSSTNAHDSIYLVCTAANTEWTVTTGSQGNITYV